MAEPTPWMLFAFCVLLLIIAVLIGRRMDILSRRLDLVHKRITLNNEINGLKNGGWDSEDAVGRQASD